jgi:hypothetical protein
MSTPSQRGHLAWAIQNKKVDDGTFNPAASATATANNGDVIAAGWFRHRAETVNIGVNDFYDVLPQEVGGSLFVNSTYKNGSFVAGGGRIYTRLEESLGYLLFAAAGTHSAVAVATATADPLSDVYTNTFAVSTSDETRMPWMALRKFTPAASGQDGATEYFADCKVNMLTLNVPAMGPTMAEFSVIGRKPTVVASEVATGATVNGVANAFESGASLAHSCTGEILLPGFTNSQAAAYIADWSGGKFTSAQIMIANNISQPDQQMVIGAYHPDDLVPLSRAVQLRLIYKWTDPKLYRKLLYNGSTSWSPIVQNSEISIKTASVDNISGETVPYSMKFTAKDVDWTMSPPQLAGNNLLFTEFTGIVRSGNNSGVPAWKIDLVNKKQYTNLSTAAAY